MLCYVYSVSCYQGRIELPKAVRGHATYIDGKMLSVTNINIEFKFGLYKHVNRRRAPLMRSRFVLTIEMADIPSVASLMRT